VQPSVKLLPDSTLETGAKQYRIFTSPRNGVSTELSCTGGVDRPETDSLSLDVFYFWLGLSLIER
jgi:hypothetical protein